MENKKVKKAKKEKPKIVKVEHNGVTTYKVAPKQSHMTKKTKIVLVSVLCAVPILLGLIIFAIVFITKK